MPQDRITVEADVEAPPQALWDAYTTPADIDRWNAASDDWQCLNARTEVREGGAFSCRMEARDGSAGFDFEATYSSIEEPRALTFEFGGRTADVTFEPSGDRTHATVSFDPDPEHERDAQAEGWQAILDNFKRFVEDKAKG